MNPVEAVKQVIVENQQLKCDLKRVKRQNEKFAWDNQRLRRENKLLETSQSRTAEDNLPKRVIIVSNDELLAEYNSALKLAKTTLLALENLGRETKNKRALLEADLIGYQLKDLKQVSSIDKEEQNRKLIAKQAEKQVKQSKLFSW